MKNNRFVKKQICCLFYTGAAAIWAMVTPERPRSHYFLKKIV
jgi:hypothetical protein